MTIWPMSCKARPAELLFALIKASKGAHRDAIHPLLHNGGADVMLKLWSPSYDRETARLRAQKSQYVKGDSAEREPGPG